MLLLAASLLFTEPLPLDMPRAAAYLVRERGVSRLEDRFEKLDLWVSQSVDGRWMDEEGRVFTLAHLDTLPPTEEAARETVTRTAYGAGRVSIDRRDKAAVRTALAALSPVAVPEKETRPRQLPRGYRDVDYYQGTNRTAIVCAFLPEKARTWRLAMWELVEGDDFDAARETFEKELFAEKKGSWFFVETRAKEPKTLGERDLLRHDAAHSVAAYDVWKVTDADAFTVLDDLPGRDFVVMLTNDWADVRRAYAETFPTPIDGTNTLSVARLYANRAEYLDALSASGLTNMTWSAAYWSPVRRELVACLPPDGSHAEFLRTLRHEAFHQYLSYATALLPVSPWLNEGYAQFFEDGAAPTARRAWWEPLGAKPDANQLDRQATLLPALLLMDHAAFYAGTDAERTLKYALAHSLAVFLEEGAPAVRFQPFKDVKKDYVAALLETGDMRKATEAAFRGGERVTRLVAEWKKFWKER